MKKSLQKIIQVFLVVSVAVFINIGAVAAKSPTIVKVSVNNNFKPIAFTAKNGKLTGYDIEVIKEVDRRLPEYKFVLEGQDSVSNLLGVETGKYAFVRVGLDAS